MSSPLSRLLTFPPALLGQCTQSKSTFARGPKCRIMIGRFLRYNRTNDLCALLAMFFFITHGLCIHFKFVNITKNDGGPYKNLKLGPLMFFGDSSQPYSLWTVQLLVYIVNLYLQHPTVLSSIIIKYFSQGYCKATGSQWSSLPRTLNLPLLVTRRALNRPLNISPLNLGEDLPIGSSTLRSH